jgi:hypothetical protein
MSLLSVCLVEQTFISNPIHFQTQLSELNEIKLDFTQCGRLKEVVVPNPWTTFLA